MDSYLAKKVKQYQYYKQKASSILKELNNTATSSGLIGGGEGDLQELMRVKDEILKFNLASIIDSLNNVAIDDKSVRDNLSKELSHLVTRLEKRLQYEKEFKDRLSNGK